MKMKATFVMVLSLSLLVFSSAGSFAFAEDESQPEGVLGCNGVQLDPAMALADQQDICGSAEQLAATSCGRSGHGTCSSPKTNDTNPEGTHCVCLSEETEAAVA